MLQFTFGYPEFFANVAKTWQDMADHTLSGKKSLVKPNKSF